MSHDRNLESFIWSIIEKNGVISLQRLLKEVNDRYDRRTLTLTEILKEVKLTRTSMMQLRKCINNCTQYMYIKNNTVYKRDWILSKF